MKQASDTSLKLRLALSLLFSTFLFPFFFLQSCSSGRAPISSGSTSTSSVPVRSEQSPVVESIRPPWQLWLAEPSDTPLGQADTLSDAGRMDEAMKIYRDLEFASAPGRAREEAFVRRVGVLLKLGKSREALEQITEHLKAENIGTDKISPILSMLAAYAYIHIGDYDQALAWFGTVLRKSDRRSVVARRTQDEVVQLIGSISAANFGSAYQVWSSDQLFAPLFEEEKRRRTSGGLVNPSTLAKWYEPKTYGAVSAVTLKESDLHPVDGNVPVPVPNSLVIGLLLPESGKYAEHAAKIRDGLELALRDTGRKDQIQVAVADSTADPAHAEQEYERLCREQGAAIVMGPLLAKVSEQVARRSDTLKVPLLSFTKRPGITALSNVSFRLGATAENQSQELVEYSLRQLQKKKFALLVAQDGANGEEFSIAFRNAVSKLGGEIVGGAEYLPKNPQSIGEALQKVSASGADAVLLSESIETAVPLLEALKSSSLKNAAILAPATWNDPIAARGYAQLLDGVIVATPFFTQSEQPETSGFISRFRQAFGREPDLLSAQAYDAAQIVISALSNTPVGSADFREKFISGLKSVDKLVGVTGKLTVGDDGEITRRMSILRLHQGEILEVMKGGNVTGFVSDESSAQETKSQNNTPPKIRDEQSPEADALRL